MKKDVDIYWQISYILLTIVVNNFIKNQSIKTKYTLTEGAKVHTYNWQSTHLQSKGTHLQLTKYTLTIKRYTLLYIEQSRNNQEHSKNNQEYTKIFLRQR